MASYKQAKQEALEFLRSHNVGVLATVDSSGQPFVSPIYYHSGEEFTMFFITARNTHKALNIKHNSRVAFTVGFGPEYISVMIRGKISASSSDEENQVLPNLIEKPDKGNGFDWPVRKLEDFKEQNMALYKIVPDEVTFLNINSKQEPKSTSDHLYHLIG